jgi:hypothetical protein
MTLPDPISNPDWTEVIGMARDVYLPDLLNEDSKEDPHYLYEEVMMALFGKNIFDTIAKIKRQNEPG